MNKLPNSVSTLQIGLCQNDERGEPLDRITAVAVGWPHSDWLTETCMSLVSQDLIGGEPVWTNDRLIQLHGYSFKYSYCAWHVGNWAWNEYTMPSYYAVGLLNVLLKSGRWDMEEGYDELAEKWKTSTELTLADFGFTGYPPWQQTGTGFHIHGEPLNLFQDPNEKP